MADLNIVECRPGRYYLGAWFLYDSDSLPSQDWFGAVFREANDLRWTLRYRHQYFTSNRPWHENDRRSNYEMILGEIVSEPEMLRKMDKFVDELCRRGGFRKDFVYFGTDDGEAIVERISARPWAHPKFTEQPKVTKS